jgi:hypothetical protein
MYVYLSLVRLVEERLHDPCRFKGENVAVILHIRPAQYGISLMLAASHQRTKALERHTNLDGALPAEDLPCITSALHAVFPVRPLRCNHVLHLRPHDKVSQTMNIWKGH